MTEFERIVRFRPAFSRRDPDPAKDYGVHGVEIHFGLRGPDGAVTFVLYTGWLLPETVGTPDAGEPLGGWRYGKALVERGSYPMPAQVSYHLPEPRHDYETGADDCEWIGGGPCLRRRHLPGRRRLRGPDPRRRRRGRHLDVSGRLVRLASEGRGMKRVEDFRIDSDEDGWELHLLIEDEDDWLRLNIHGVAPALADAVAKEIGGWLTEGRRLADEHGRDMERIVRDEEDLVAEVGYDLTDPKSPGYYDRMADAADLVRDRAKERTE